MATLDIGQGINKVPSRSTWRRRRINDRKIMASHFKSNFEPPKRAIIHLDGKIMQDNNRINGDRLAVVCSGNKKIVYREKCFHLK